jgi:hypothetical protein
MKRAVRYGVPTLLGCGAAKLHPYLEGLTH